MPDDAQAGAGAPDGGLRRVLEHTDYHVGRLIDAIETLGALDNTLVYYIIGDNGASAEGTVNGAFNEMANFNGIAAIETPEFMASMKDKLGTRRRLQPLRGGLGVGDVLAVPVDQAGRLALGRHPQRHHRALAGRHRGQGRDPVPVHPRASTSPRRSSRRPGLPEPTFVNGVQQSPIEGTSMLYSFDDADAPERHDLQYFEMAGNRGIYFKGWSAVTRHSTPWLPNEVLPALDDDVWELYDGTTDWTQARDLAARAARAARGPAAPVADRGGEVQRAADRRPPVRAAQRRPSPGDRS